MELFQLSEVDSSWSSLFEPHITLIDQILTSLSGVEIAPPREQIFRAFSLPRERVRVVIVGQDPYPALGVADGLAFSANARSPIPASLRNIFKEYASDLSLPTPTTPDLTPWFGQGVLLLNRTLTTIAGERNAHSQEGWRELTFDIARALGGDKVIALLWGRHAQELAPLFTDSIQSAHPSPLSARRGFFGSKPFSQVNQILLDRGEVAIDWQLS